jgi:hypothetical protein
MSLWRMLTARSEQRVPASLVAAVLLGLGAYSGSLALGPAGPPVTDGQGTDELVLESRDLIPHGDGLMRAVRDGDQNAVGQLRAEQEAWFRRDQERAAERAAAVRVARGCHGLLAALSLIVGGWLLVASRGRSPLAERLGHAKPGAAPDRRGAQAFSFS